MMRRIGNGANTPIWGTAWLTSDGSGKIITSRPIYSSFPNILGDLIDWNRGAWDLVVINQHMWACDASRILEVPIGYETSPDCFYWSLSKHGNFKVRYCYYHILESAKSSDTSNRGRPTSSHLPSGNGYGAYSFPQRAGPSCGVHAMIFFPLRLRW